MAKNPVMPVYYNDLRGSTQDWTDEELGCYFRLLMYQWDKGNVPGDSNRRLKIAETSAKNWPLISTKFLENEDKTLFNQKLEEIREQKKKHSEKQAGNVSKRYQKSTNSTTKTSTKKLPLEDEKEIEDELKVSSVNTPGEKIETIAPGPETPPTPGPIIYKDAEILIVPELIAYWKIAKPDYVVDNFTDFPAVRQIAEMIAAKKNLTNIAGIEKVKVIKASFELIVTFAKDHSLYKDFQLSQISKYFNAICSAMVTANKTAATGVTPGKASLVKNNIDAAAGARAILGKKYNEQTTA